MEVTGVPEFGADGSVIGSLGFLRNRSLDAAHMGIHQAIENSSTWKELLVSLAGELRNVIAHHTFLVTLVSEHRRHLRRLIEEPEFQQASAIRWWPMPPFVRKMLAELDQTSAMSVEEMFRKPDYQKLLAIDRPTQEWMKRGFKHLLRRPVFQKGVLVAIVMLQRTEDVPFSDLDIQTFDQLPVGEAVNIALALDKRQEMQFGLDLIRDLGKVANDAAALRRNLVDRLRENYSWEHVSLFRIDEDRRNFRLVCQSPADPPQLPVEYTQPYEQGLLGVVRKTGAAVIVGNVQKDRRYLRGVDGMQSEMCLPVPGTKLRWILSIESALLDAFAEEEQQSVELLLAVVGFLLDRVETIEMKSAIFDSVADGVILTSQDGVIDQVNPAGARILGAAEAELVGRNLADFVAPNDPSQPVKGYGARLISAPTVASVQTDLVDPAGRRVPVLLSGATLPQQLGGRVYVASDLRFARRVEQMQALKQVFSSIAAEMRIPLSLACSFLGDVSKKAGNNVELADKALAQLRKADLPLERILRLAAMDDDAPLAITDVDVGEVLARIKSELPRSHASEIEVNVAPGVGRARAAYSELSFCIQSIVAFLLRQKAQADSLAVDIHAADDGKIGVDIRLVSKDADRVSETEVPKLEKTVREFVLADELIGTLMARMGGEYRARESGSHFHLSIAAQEVRHEILAPVGA